MVDADGTRGQPRRPHPGYIRQIHLELVLLLVVIVVTTAAIGWSLRRHRTFCLDNAPDSERCLSPQCVLRIEKVRDSRHGPVLSVLWLVILGIDGAGGPELL